LTNCRAAKGVGKNVMWEMVQWSRRSKSSTRFSPVSPLAAARSRRCGGTGARRDWRNTLELLVGHSSGFRNDGVWLDRKGSPLTDVATITERIRRVNYGRLETQVTINDPKAYTRPFTVTLNEYLEPASELMDFVCLENDSSGPQFLGK
jgi:hypothetical protein